MNKVKALVLKLRFPAFRDAPSWESRQLVDVCSKITQGGTPDTSKPEYWGGAINWMTPAEMGKTESPFIAATNRTITEQGLRDCSSDLLPVNSVILSVRAPIGHLAINTAPMAINQGCKGLIAGKSLDFYFLYCSLVGSKTRLIDLGAGNTFKELSGTALKRFEIPIPSPAEQQKIAECLSSVDELIAVQARKLDALKTHKKWLMQQLFPTEGETQPRLRFPEFRKGPKWKMRKIGSMLLESPRPIKLEDDREYCLVTVKRRYGGLVSRGILKGREIKVTSQFLVKTDDFLISKRQIVHNACGLIPIELDGSVVSNEYSVLTPVNGCHIQFFDYFAQQPCVSESFMQCSVGIVIEKMLFKLDRWLKREFHFPSFEEQQRIADCLTSLDALIAAQTQKLDALKTHKKGLMQQLFPSPAEVEA
jgi:type I restriction enzyme S subunit